MWVKLLKEWDGQAVGTEIDLADEKAKVLIEEGTAEASQGTVVKEAVGTLVSSVVQGVSESLPGIIRTQLAEALQNASVPAGGAEPDRVYAQPLGTTHDRRLDDPSGGFPLFSEFAFSVYQSGLPGRRPDERLLVQAPSGLSEVDDAHGGYLVPPVHLNQLLKLAHERAELFNRARYLPMATNALDIPVLGNRDRRKGYRNGGVVVYWVDEAGLKVAADPTPFEKVGLKLNELAGVVYVTNTLLEDSPISLETLLGDMFADELAIVVDDALLRGTGAGQPLGILNAPALITQAAEAGQAAATIVADNIINMWMRMWGPSKKNAVWFYNSECLGQLMAMSMVIGAGGVALWMPANGLAGQPYSTLFGRPCVELEHCSALGTIGDIFLADWKYYLVAQKARKISTATSIHLRFLYDETAFRFTMRVDGQPWLRGDITPMYGTLTRSPFVALATRP